MEIDYVLSISLRHEVRNFWHARHSRSQGHWHDAPATDEVIGHGVPGDLL